MPRASPERGAPVTLDATLYLPAEPRPCPPCCSRTASAAPRPTSPTTPGLLAEQGYVVLAYSARGFGASGGLVHLDAPAYEVADARRLLDLLAAPPRGAAGRPGRPAGRRRRRLLRRCAGAAARRATTSGSTRSCRRSPGTTCGRRSSPSSRSRRRRPGRRPTSRPAGGPGVFKKAVGRHLLRAGRLGRPRCGAWRRAGRCRRRPRARPDPAPCGRFAPRRLRGLPAGGRRGRGRHPQALALLAASSPATVLDRIKAPTLLVQGEADSLFPLSEGDANARGHRRGRAPRSRWSGTAAATTAASTRPTGCGS